MVKSLLSFAAAALFVGALYGQEIRVVSEPPTPRAYTRLYFYYPGKRQPAGQVAISFGQPDWNAQYADSLDRSTKGKYWRLGKDIWTILDTQLPITIGGIEVPVGAYFLAVQRTEDGQSWSLVLIDPQAVRELRMDANEVRTARMSDSLVKMKAPLRFTQRSEIADKLSIQLQEDETELTKANLIITWGQYELSAPLTIRLGGG